MATKIEDVKVEVGTVTEDTIDILLRSEVLTLQRAAFEEWTRGDSPDILDLARDVAKYLGILDIDLDDKTSVNDALKVTTFKY